MKIQQAMRIFDTLSQETRLRTLRLLVQAGPDGIAAGIIGNQLGIAHNTLSFHLNHLLDAGLVSSNKQGRSVIYSANFEAVSGLIGFLIKDCCNAEFVKIHESNETGCSIIELSDCCPPVTRPLSKKTG